MGILDKHLQNLHTIHDNIEDIAGDIVGRNSERIIQILQDKQLGIGKYSDGSLLGTYSPYTQEYADEENVRFPKDDGQPYNFQWTGSTFSKMILKYDVVGQDYSIFSRDAKQELLKSIYGDELFKLTEANNKIINETIIEPELIIYIEENWWRLDMQ